MSSYQIHWVVLEPLKGKATKRDVKAFNSADNIDRFKIIFNNNNYVMAHASSKDEALLLISKIKGLAHKEYKATLITDKQFGMIKKNYSDNTISIPFTQKQLEESVNI